MGTATQLYDNSSPHASTSSSPVSAFRTDSTLDEGSTPCLSETSSPLMNSTTHSTCASGSVPELMHDEALEDLTVIGDAAASTETLELLEESFAPGPGVEHGGEPLPNRPYPNKSCAVGKVVPDVGAAPRETAVASWVRPHQQQIPLIALSTESEMPSAPDPFSVLCHHVNSSELLEESFASGPGVEHGGEPLPNKPHSTKSCDVGKVVPDAGAAPRETSVASWVRPHQQQMPFIALSTEFEMPSTPDPFSVLCHHVNSSELLEESFALGPCVEHGSEPLPNKPHPTKSCDVGKVVL